MTTPCKDGDRIRLLAMPDDPAPLDAGSEGTVIGDPVDFQGRWQIIVAWDNGRSLNLCSPPDRFEVLP